MNCCCSVSKSCPTPTLCTTACQALLSSTVSCSLLKSMSIVSDTIYPSHPLLTPSPFAFSLSQLSGSFPMSWFFISGSQSIAVLALASVLLMNTQGWFPFSSVQSSCSVVSNSLQPHESQHTRSPYHHLPEFTQTHIHWVGDAIQPSHPLLSPFPSAPNPSQHQSLFQWVNSLHEVGSTNLNSMQSKGLSRVFSNTTIQKLQFFNAQLSLWSNSDIHTWLLE